MTLTDASPLIALINVKGQNHEKCLAVLPSLPAPLLTTWPAFTEAMYLLFRYGGHPAQSALWGYVQDGVIEFHLLGTVEQARMPELMVQYRDRPMDLADASLVATAEVLGLLASSPSIAKIFTSIVSTILARLKSFPDSLSYGIQSLASACFSKGRMSS